MALCKCGNPARFGQQSCYDCHNSYMRAWRLTHPLTPEQRLKMNARSQVHVYLKRGKLVRGPCEVEGCEAVRTQPHHDDYGKPRDVRWFCRRHHLALHGAEPRK